jgi:hypothetical protein
MPCYRIFRLKDSLRAAFRSQPHLAGVAVVKPKDYELVGEVEAPSPYALWLNLKDTPQALEVGDILEIQGGGLRIVKYIGFEEAKWLIPESKQLEEVMPENRPPDAGMDLAEAASTSGNAPAATEVQ